MESTSRKRRIKIVIVGAEQKHWSYPKECMVRGFIAQLMINQPTAIFISGDCPKGGVDQWVREIAKFLNKTFISYPPKKNSWYWYRKRNIQMAQEGDYILDLEPLGHTSGGTWTLNYGLSIGKKGEKVEF